MWDTELMLNKMTKFNVSEKIQLFSFMAFASDISSFSATFADN